MKNLAKYIERKNAIAAIFGEKFNFGNPVLDINNLTQADIKHLSDCLDGDLSPENLCCDGELRGPALAKKAAFLNACVKELAAVSKKVA